MEMENDAVKQALGCRTIAVVGLSKDPAKASYNVAAYLQAHGYKIVPVNPTADTVLGEKCFASLSAVPDVVGRTVELVNVFRKSEETGTVIDEAIQLKKKFGVLGGVWLQLGIVNARARQRCEDAGLFFVEDKCLKIEHARNGGA